MDVIQFVIRLTVLMVQNEEGKGSAEEKEDTSVPSEAKKELELVEKVVDDAATADATCVDEKKIEEVKSETPVEQNVEEVVKPSLEGIPSPVENKADEEKVAAAEEAPAETTVEEVKPETETTPADEKTATEEKKIEEKLTPEDPKPEASSVEIKKTQEKPATKKGKFWWDK